MKTISLTRAQWNAIWDEAKQVRASAGGIELFEHSLREVGFDVPADRISHRLWQIFNCASAIQRVLIDAEEAMPDEDQQNREGEA